MNLNCMICCLWHILSVVFKREDAFRAVEASERIGVHLWLRCRLALFQSLSATVLFGVPPLQGLFMCCATFHVQFIYFITKQYSNITKEQNNMYSRVYSCLHAVLLVVF